MNGSRQDRYRGFSPCTSMHATSAGKLPGPLLSAQIWPHGIRSGNGYKVSPVSYRCRADDEDSDWPLGLNVEIDVTYSMTDGHVLVFVLPQLACGG